MDKDLVTRILYLADVALQEPPVITRTEVEDLARSIKALLTERQNESPCGSGAKGHGWTPWHSIMDQFGLLAPHSDGVYYRYRRECNFYGCSAVQYVENLEPRGASRYEGSE